MKNLTQKEFAEGKEGLVYMPYKTIVVKTIITDENGTTETWQIGRWKRFKLWVSSLFYKTIEL